MTKARHILASLLTLGVFVAVATPPAQADVSHEYLSQITEVPVGAKTVGGEAAITGPLREVDAITVDSGDLWVAERLYGQNDPGRNSRVDEFDASTHAFVEQLNLTGPEVGGGEELYGGRAEKTYDGIAVGHATGEAQVYFAAAAAGTGEVAVSDPATGDPLAAWTGAETPAHEFGYSGVRDVAVDNALGFDEGDVYVADTAAQEYEGQVVPQDKQVVDVFEPQVGGGEKYLTQLTGACPTEDMTVGESGCKEGEGLIPFSEPKQVAVDRDNGDVLVGDSGREVIDVFEPLLGQYRFVRQLPIAGVSAVGGGVEDGDIYAATGSTVDEFSPAGVFLGELTGTPDGPFAEVSSVAVDNETGSSFEHIYVGDSTSQEKSGGLEPYTGVIDEFGKNVVVPDVTTAAVTQATPTGATLNGEVDPLEAETHEGAECWFAWGTSTALGQEAPCEPRQVAEHEGFVPVHAQLRGLEPDTTYYYRLQAKNKTEEPNLGKASQTQHFTTPGPGIHGESVSKVAATSATLQATIDPNKAPTTYYFQYGAGASYQYESPAAPGAAIGAGETDVNVERHVQENLAPDTVYHYRAVAVSEVTIEVAPTKFETKVEEFPGEDHTFTTQPTGSSLTLPDDRAWELVSPHDKRGALIYPINEYQGVIEAAANGAAITYETNAPIESSPRGYPYRDDQVLARRTSGGWSNQDIDTPHNYESGVPLDDGYEYKFFSPDLSLALVEPGGAFTPLERDGVSEEVAPRATERGEYVRSDFTCQATPATCYTPLVTEANTPPETAIGENEENPVEPSAVKFVDATPDLSHVVLRSAVPLIEGAPAGTTNANGSGALYEWSGGRLQLVSVLPASEGGAGVLAEVGGVANDDLEARNAISSDGSRVIWTSLINKGLYMSDTAGGKTETVRIGEAGATVIFTDAGSDDSKVFFTQSEKAEADLNGNHGDLYVFEVTSGAGEPLAGRVTRLTEGAEVQGAVLGASEDGSYVYYVANGVLGGGAAHGATAGNCGLIQGGGQQAEEEKARETCNLYVSHYNGETRTWEAPTFIATLSGEDRYDWFYAEPFRRPSRVSPDGRYLAFMSQRSLTGYDNTDVNEATGKHADEEVYLYDSVEHRLVCASCNPTGARPVGAETNEAGVVDDNMWPAKTWLAANVPGYTTYDGPTIDLYQSRYLSNSGRLFFNSHEALVPQDVNGQWDVYEYEPPVGAGGGTESDSCTTSSATFSPRSDGCVGLISSGESAEESGFLDASEDGDDVFFLTTSRLSGQDIDSDYDVYDAHVCGAEGVPCTTSLEPPPPCTTEASCKPAPIPQPTLYSPPASATFNGPGNLAPPPPAVVKKATTKKPVKCKHGFVKKKVKKKETCVKAKSKKSKRAKKASHNGRAGR